MDQHRDTVNENENENANIDMGMSIDTLAKALSTIKVKLDWI